MVMLKDNYVQSCGGSIEAAVEEAKGVSGFCQQIEVECQSLDEAMIAAGTGADIRQPDPDVNRTPTQQVASYMGYRQLNRYILFSCE